MYGKCFESMYDGTLRADWKATVTLQQLIILADKDGIVDMTVYALHGRTGIPLEILEHGIEYLSKPDPHSRSPKLDGIRIILIDEDRNWGWEIVNYSHYRDLASKEDKKEKDRIRIAEKRAKSKVSRPVVDCSNESESVAEVAYTDTDTDVNVNTSVNTTSSAPPVLAIPTNKFNTENEEYPVTYEQVAQWQEAYSSINVFEVLKRIRSWGINNPKKRKTMKGMAKHIDSWLAKEHDKGNSNGAHQQFNTTRLQHSQQVSQYLETELEKENNLEAFRNDEGGVG